MAYLIERRDRGIDASIRVCEPEPTEAEAVATLRRAIDEFGDVVSTPTGPAQPITVGEVARGELNEANHLQIGMVGPATEGVDLDGQPLRLADYRGRVVVLSFWGSWCGPCLALVPHERTLVERMKGKPFALIGVNSDETPARARAIVAREAMTWPSWFDGGLVGGPIAERWNAGSWPTVYVLDAEGRIRWRGHGPDGLDAAVDAAFEPIRAADR